MESFITSGQVSIQCVPKNYIYTQLVLLFLCLCLTSHQQLRSYGDGPWLKVSSDRLVKLATHWLKFHILGFVESVIYWSSGIIIIVKRLIIDNFENTLADAWTMSISQSRLYGPRRDKTCLRRFRQSETQTSLLSYRD